MNPTLPLTRLLLNRRALLGAVGASAVAGLATTNLPRAAAARPGYEEALDLGYTLAFEDDFTSADTIDLQGDGSAGHNWYTDMWEGSRTPAWCLDVQGTVLAINQAFTNTNYAISTVSPRTGEGRSFGYGYYEARMRFDPSLGSSTNGYPSFWTCPRSRFHDPQSARHAELDVFEAYHEPYAPYEGYYAGTLHDHSPRWAGATSYRNLQNRNNVTLVNNTNRAWHNYGCLWLPGRVSWYYDGALMSTVTYGAGQTPSATAWDTATGQDVSEVGTFSVAEDMAREGVGLILGTAPGWPLEVDWVRVFQR